MVARALVLVEHAADRAGEALAALIALAGHDLDLYVRREEPRCAHRVVGVDAVEVRDQHLLDRACVDQLGQRGLEPVGHGGRVPKRLVGS